MNKRIYSDITASIKSLDPTAEVSVVGNDIKKITWFDNNPNNITEEQILAKQTELEAEYDAQDYARKREAEYPTIEELVVALYDTEDKVAIEAKRAEVKAKYPK
jgi:hypothetical protein